MNRISPHRRPWPALVAVGLVALLGTVAQAETVNIVGVGAATCTQFNEEIARRPSAERDYLAWAQGFMSGALLRAPKGVDEDLNLLRPSFPLEKQAAFLRTYCVANPHLSYSDAVHALYKHLKGSPI